MIKEWSLLRVIACLSIVLLHSTTQTGIAVGYPDIENYHIYRIILCFATPTFIVLSELIIANRYKDTIPSQFFSKRLKFIFGPFITFAVIDALVTNYLSGTGINISEKIFDNLLGNYEGYFILIIFQFYVLHYIIVRFGLSVEKLLAVSILIMLIHLYILNYSNAPFIVDNRNWLKIPFTAWFGYFTVAYLLGKHYEVISKFLKKYKWLTLVFVFFAIYLVFMSYNAGAIAVNSRRLDIFPLSIAISLTILAWGQFIPNIKIVNIISNYSLGIYLLHWQVQKIIAPYIGDFFSSTSTRVLVLFFASLIISMVTIKVISLLPFGKYLVGNTKRVIRKEKNKNILSNAETSA